MEVKDLTYSANGVVPTGKQRSLKALPRVTPAPVPSNPDSANINISNSQVSKSEAALMQADALVSDISDNATSINAYVKSLGGIIDQGLKETSDVRRNALSKEANQVLQAIRDRTITIRAHETQSSVLDPLRSEVEAKIGRTLDILFHDDSSAGGGLPEISFSNKDLIISIQTKILRTSQYLESLKREDPKKDPEMKAILDKAETAQVNAESAQTSVRDVNSAFQLVQETSQLIGSDSKTALFAVGAVREQIDVSG